MNDDQFRAKRRQLYLNEESYLNTCTFLRKERKPIQGYLASGALSPIARATNLGLLTDVWEEFQLCYTAGEDLTALAQSLTKVVDAYEAYAEALLGLPDDKYHPPFDMNEMIDEYVDYLHLLCAAVLLHREDLIPRIHALNEGTDFDGVDAVIEELLKFYFPDRPGLDEWLYNKPYRGLLDAIDADTPEEMAKDMKKYVKAWYPGMKGQAHFWGKHEQITPEFTPYYGYWAMCAAAFSYLYELDDSSYRNEIVYPKDLVDYARSKPRRTPAQAAGLVPQELLRVQGGQPCPQTGYWFTPAKSDSRRHFNISDLMPVFEDSAYGTTIWQWSQDQ